MEAQHAVYLSTIRLDDMYVATPELHLNLSLCLCKLALFWLKYIYCADTTEAKRLGKCYALEPDNTFLGSYPEYALIK